MSISCAKVEGINACVRVEQKIDAVFICLIHTQAFVLVLPKKFPCFIFANTLLFPIKRFSMDIV